MNQMQYQAVGHTPQQHLGPTIPPNPPPSSSFWAHTNVQPLLKELHQTLSLAYALQMELEMLMKVKQRKGCVENCENVDGLLTDSEDVDEFIMFMEDNRIDLEGQVLSSVEAVNELMAKLRFLLEPFRVVTDEGCPWEEKSAAVRLCDKIKKSKRNMRWRRRKRRRVAQMLAKEGERFEILNREADEWRAREMAKDLAQLKVENMKKIAEVKAKEERRKLEAELELALMVEKLQELRSIRIQKLKKQGHFLPEEDDKFLERVRAAVEEEERQAKAAADTDAAKDAIIAAEESRKVSHGVNIDSRDEISKDGREESEEQKNQSGIRDDALALTSKGSEKQGLEAQNYKTYDYVANLPPEFYHYYHGSNTDMGTLIEVRRTWDAYIRPGGSRIPGHWVQPPPPADEIWASYILHPK